MAQQYEGTTDRLVSIIASIKLERRSGQLTVRRGEGPTLEEGFLLFAQGQVIQATAGRRSGSEAVNWLSTWRQASYVFLPSASEKDAPPAPIPPRPAPTPPQAMPDVPQARNDVPRWEPAPAMAFISEVPSVIIDLSAATARIDRVGLARTYRRLYMLIDGRRCVGELVPLLGRPAEEVRNMLRNLEWLGIIRIAPPPPAEF